MTIRVMQWGKKRENMIKIFPFGLQKDKPSKFLFSGHDALYWRNSLFMVRIMKPWVADK